MQPPGRDCLAIAHCPVPVEFFPRQEFRPIRPSLLHTSQPARSLAGSLASWRPFRRWKIDNYSPVCGRNGLQRARQEHLRPQTVIGAHSSSAVYSNARAADCVRLCACCCSLLGQCLGSPHTVCGTQSAAHSLRAARNANTGPVKTLRAYKNKWPTQWAPPCSPRSP